MGSGSGDQIKVRAKIGANAETSGYLVSQRSTNRFKVTAGGNTGVCTLVNKESGSLAADEMIVNVKTDAGDIVQVTKLYNRTAITEGNTKVKWTHVVSVSDDSVQVADVEDATLVTISIDTHPVDATVAAPAPNVFGVAATGVADLTYQWELSIDAGGTWNDIVGETASSYTISDSTGLTGNQYRVVVSSASSAADPVTSNVATLTVT